MEHYELKYPSQLKPGDLIYDIFDKIDKPITDVSVTTSVYSGKVNSRCAWVFIKGSAYNPDVLCKRFKSQGCMIYVKEVVDYD
jgi:hypothetical protein